MASAVAAAGRTQLIILKEYDSAPHEVTSQRPNMAATDTAAAGAHKNVTEDGTGTTAAADGGAAADRVREVEDAVEWIAMQLKGTQQVFYM